MFLRCKVRRKDGKQHRYWSLVENTRVGRGRVVQRHYSPEARGLLSMSKGGARFPHLAEPAPAQAGDRLPKELALAGMTTIAATNRWLAETYWPAHNAAFAVAPAETGSVHWDTKLPPEQAAEKAGAPVA